jgi:tetratricopeptide (TPR) repeat protein
MPAHIFVQHGMWDEVVASNTASYDASVTRAERKGLSPTKRSFHALYWLQYGYLQQGRYDEAGRCLEEIRSVAERRDTLKSIKSQLAKMEALQTVETEVWKTMNVDGLLEQIRKNPDEVSPQASGAVLLAAGMSAIRLGDRAAAENAASGMAALRQHSEASSERSLNQIAIMEKELQALIQFERGDQEQAIATLKEATAIAESMPPPSGPPGEADTDPAIKPSHELLGEMLLALDRAAEARAVFESALLRMPNRPRSLLGAARASARSGDEGAARLHYRQLTRIPGAGADLPGLDEARSYLKSATEQP